MQLDQPLLAALVAVIRGGSFEAAARALHVTPSAVSQRIKLLEERVGGVLVVRGAPCRLTLAGEPLYRHGVQVELLEEDVLRGLGRQARGTALGIAVNADSLATWIVPALAAFTAETGLDVELIADDEEDTAGWLRSGRVLGAVTSQARAVQGCRVSPLGAMRYRAAASPRFIRRWFARGFTAEAVRAAPVLCFDHKDGLQARFVSRALGSRAACERTCYLPSPNAFVEACLHGLGWGVSPEALLTAHLRRGRLRELVPSRPLDVTLYWQAWSIESPSLSRLRAAIEAQARRSLLRPRAA